MSSTAELYMLDHSGNRCDQPWHVWDKFFVVLKSHLEPNTEVTQQDVLNRLDSLHPSRRDPQKEPDGEPIESVGTFDYNILGVFHIIARQLPHDDPRQEKLVACLKFISLTHGGPHNLDEQLDFEYNYRRRGELNTTRWRNFNAYTARITRDGIGNLISWGIIAMRGVWIKDVRVQLRHAHAKSKDTVSVQVRNKDVDTDVPVGLDWIQIAGALLYKAGLEEKSDDTPSKSAWGEWKENVREIVGDEGVSEETKAKAEELERIMGELEQQGCS